MDYFEIDEADAYLWRVGLKCEGERNEHMLNYEQVLGNVSERRESKCCAVLVKHSRKVKGEQLITLQMARQQKTENINVVLRQLLSSV